MESIWMFGNVRNILIKFSSYAFHVNDILVNWHTEEFFDATKRIDVGENVFMSVKWLPAAATNGSVNHFIIHKINTRIKKTLYETKSTYEYNIAICLHCSSLCHLEKSEIKSTNNYTLIKSFFENKNSHCSTHSETICIFEVFIS